MNGAAAAYAIDTLWARRSFDRACDTYEAAAVLQAELSGLLLDRLALTQLEPSVAIDLGAGTGRVAQALHRRYPNSLIIAVDSATKMLRAARRRRSWRKPFALLGADAEQLPLADASVDLIVSNCMLQWSDLDAVFAECRRLLAPRGFFSFTTLGPDTLKELRIAWTKADPCHTRVAHFADMHDVGDALVRAGFVSPVLDVDRYTLHYADVRSLAADLRAIGARNATAGRQKGLTPPSAFAAMESAYELFRLDGRLPATYEVVFGQAWTPRAPEPPRSDSALLPLEEFKRQLRRRAP